MITPEQKEFLGNKIEDEGFDYCFLFWSDFPDIEDTEFRTLLNNWLAARKAFVTYLQKQGVNERR
jgi:hypothetical protein